jgi:UDP-glucose-4-epimerase GalE
MALSRAKIVVTGGAGYIGSHTCKVLASNGYEPVTFDNLSTGHAWAVKWGPLEIGDLADLSRIREVFHRHRPSAVIHFAASAYVGESMKAPKQYFQNNVVNALNLLNVMLECGIGKMVFSSSCATYGIPAEVPIEEDSPQNPVNPYGDTKLMVEKILRWYSKAYDFQFCALRYFNAAGADPGGEIGEVHEPETHLIPLAISSQQENGPILSVFGIDYPTFDGTCIRDYVHVVDLAEAHVLALKNLHSGRCPEFINLGTEKGTSIFELIRCVEKISGKGVNYKITDKRDGDPPSLIAKTGRAREIEWMPRYSNLETIVDTALKWDSIYREQNL